MDGRSSEFPRFRRNRKRDKFYFNRFAKLNGIRILLQIFANQKANDHFESFHETRKNRNLVANHCESLRNKKESNSVLNHFAEGIRNQNFVTKLCDRNQNFLQRFAKLKVNEISLYVTKANKNVVFWKTDARLEFFFSGVKGECTTH
jgi:hypothetical protein